MEESRVLHVSNPVAQNPRLDTASANHHVPSKSATGLPLVAPMDHLQRPLNPLYPEAIVPCLDEPHYDSLDFDTYPLRRGWDRTRLLAGDFTQHEPTKTAAFLQDWLYFGTLREVLGEYGSKVRYTQPCLGLRNGRVATGSLDEDFARHINGVKIGLQQNSKGSRAQLESAESALKLLSFFCRYKAPLEDDLQGAERMGYWPLSAEVDFSIRALGSYLAPRLYNALWDFFPDAALLQLTFGTGSLPYLRMKHAGWCPSDRTMALGQLSLAALYYASDLRRPSGIRDHNSCTEEMCVASQVDAPTYQTVHTRARCECLSLGPIVENIAAIINAGGIPLIFLSVAKDGKISLKAQPSAPGQNYVAFSHVWSDGMGNPNENKLPTCQLQRIRSLLRELDQMTSAWSLLNRGHGSRLWQRSMDKCMPFWIDTLCVPVGEEYREERRSAIVMMKETYERAHQVLVLDAELETYNMRGANDANSSVSAEAMMRIFLSGWMRRLWTLQEGVLARNLHVKFRDSILDMQVAKSLLEVGPGTTGVAGEINTTWGTVPNSAAQFYMRMKALRSSVVDTPEPRFTGTRMRYSPMNEVLAREARTGFAIMEAFLASRFRTSSKQSDEYICLASVLGLDTSMLSSVPLDQRMKHLFSKLNRLPQGLIFVPGPRMNEPGWGWAVTRFGNPGWKTRWSAPINDLKFAERNETGFTVSYPGIFLPRAYAALSSSKVMLLVRGFGGTPPGEYTFELEWLEHVNTTHRLNGAESSEGLQDIIVLFYADFGALRAGAYIAGVAVSVSTEQRHKISDEDENIVCSFGGICQLRTIDGRFLPDDASTALDHLQSGQDVISFVDSRRWTIQ